MKYIVLEKRGDGDIEEANTRRKKRGFYPVAVTNSFYKKYKLVNKSLNSVIIALKNIKEGEQEEEKNRLTEEKKRLRTERNTLLAEIKSSIEEAKEQPLLQGTKLRFKNSFEQRSNGDFKFTNAYKRRNNLGILLSGAIATVSTIGTATITAALIAGVIVATGGLVIPAVIASVTLAIVASAALFGVRTFLKRRKEYRKLESDIGVEHLEYRQRILRKSTKKLKEKLLEKGKKQLKSNKRVREIRKKKNTRNPRKNWALEKKLYKKESEEAIKNRLKKIHENNPDDGGSVFSNRSKDSADNKSVISEHSHKYQSDGSIKKPLNEEQAIENFATFVRTNTDEAFKKELDDVLARGTLEEILCAALSFCAVKENLDLFKKIEEFCPAELKKPILGNALIYEYVEEGNIAALKMVVMADLKGKLATEIYATGIMTAAILGKNDTLIELINYCPDGILKSVFDEAITGLRQIKDEKALGMVNSAYSIYQDGETLNRKMMEQQNSDGNLIDNFSDDEGLSEEEEEEEEDLSKVFKIETIKEYDSSNSDSISIDEDSYVVDSINNQAYFELMSEYIAESDEFSLKVLLEKCPSVLQENLFSRGIVDTAKKETLEVFRIIINASPRDKEEEIFTKAVAICRKNNNKEALEIIKGECSEDLKAKIFNSDENKKVSTRYTATEMGKPMGKPKSNKWGKSVRNKPKKSTSGDQEKKNKGANNREACRISI